MTSKIIIDGWNVCWKIPEIAQLIPDKLTIARQRFNSLVKIYFQKKSSISKIVYDGQPGIISSKGELKGQDIQFSKNPQNADQKIIAFLKRQNNPALWTVISSDRELTGRAKNLGASSLSSEQFITKLMKGRTSEISNPKKENPNLSKNEINDWLDIFNNY